MRPIIVPSVDVDRIFIDHFLKNWELGAICGGLGISRGVMTRLLKVKYHSIQVWAKKRALPRVEAGSYHGTNFRWVALDGDARMVAEGNRQSTMFRHVLRLLKEQGIDREQYIRGVYAPLVRI